MPTLVDSRSIVARNWATASTNKIHADDVAAQYGFRGGLVPGVSTIAYLIPGVVRALGSAWVHGGAVSVRLTAPVYDGEEIVVEAYDDGVVRLVGATGDDGRVTAIASLEAPFSLGSGLPPTRVRPALADRPTAGPESLAPGTVLGTLEHRADLDAASRYLAAINDASSAGLDEHGFVPLAWILLDANEILSSNVVLGPWIHVQSDIHTRRRVRDGAALETRGVVSAEYERKGNRFVELDVVVLADLEPVLLVHHTALYELRPR